jgi:hypothetical protein
VHIDTPGAGSLIGEIVEVEITRAHRHSLAGALTSPRPATVSRAAAGPALRRLPLC